MKTFMEYSLLRESDEEDQRYRDLRANLKGRSYLNQQQGQPYNMATSAANRLGQAAVGMGTDALVGMAGPAGSVVKAGVQAVSGMIDDYKKSIQADPEKMKFMAKHGIRNQETVTPNPAILKMLSQETINEITQRIFNDKIVNQLKVQGSVQPDYGSKVAFQYVLQAFDRIKKTGA